MCMMSSKAAHITACISSRDPAALARPTSIPPSGKALAGARYHKKPFMQEAAIGTQKPVCHSRRLKSTKVSAKTSPGSPTNAMSPTPKAATSAMASSFMPIYEGI
jgi:hypothetical protein